MLQESAECAAGFVSVYPVLQCGSSSVAAQLFSSSWNLGVIWVHPIPAIQQNSWNKQVTTLTAGAAVKPEPSASRGTFVFCWRCCQGAERELGHFWESLSSLRKLLQHECSLCPDAKPFNTFADLEQHMRKQHELFCCKLCVKHLKVSWACAWMCGVSLHDLQEFLGRWEGRTARIYFSSLFLQWG